MIRSIIAIAIFSSTILFAGCSKEDAPAPEPDLRSSMLEEVNRLRQTGCQCGADYMPPVPPVVWNEQLEAAAGAHARDMYDNNYFDHIAPDGSSPIQRAIRAGYSGSSIGENIARGYTTVQDVINGWKGSESHCKAMMDSTYKEMGAARYQDYWAQEFGAP